jgi:hypothetical protein
MIITQNGEAKAGIMDIQAYEAHVLSGSQEESDRAQMTST